MAIRNRHKCEWEPILSDVASIRKQRSFLLNIRIIVSVSYLNTINEPNELTQALRHFGTSFNGGMSPADTVDQGLGWAGRGALAAVRTAC
jgi:hypothetical protein